MPDSRIAREEPTIMHGRIGRRWVFVIALHHGITSQHNFALGFTIARHQLPRFGIHYCRTFMHREGYPLP